jgi:hypothetical protein
MRFRYTHIDQLPVCAEQQKIIWQWRQTFKVVSFFLSVTFPISLSLSLSLSSVDYSWWIVRKGKYSMNNHWIKQVNTFQNYSQSINKYHCFYHDVLVLQSHLYDKSFWLKRETLVMPFLFSCSPLSTDVSLPLSVCLSLFLSLTLSDSLFLTLSIVLNNFFSIIVSINHTLKWEYRLLQTTSQLVTGMLVSVQFDLITSIRKH